MATDAQAAFVQRLEEHRGILFKVAGAYCPNPGNREDLIQEMLVQLWRAYPRFDSRSSFSTCAYRIAVNVAISAHRREARKLRNVVTAEHSVLESVAAPQLRAEDEDRLASLREFIEQLDGLNRALMILYLDDKPYAEIAAILGISQTNVATKINRIKTRLRRSLAECG
jgi:RNA polymerase sigma factor (sigma-70 family)